MMSQATLATVKQFVSSGQCQTLDITGGAPELHPEFKALVSYARDNGVHVIDRCNLTILLEPGKEGLAAFLADHEVEIIASLPCYSADNVDRQRGSGVFAKSIAALQKLNQLGYGEEEGLLKLNLVYNPQGPSLPPSQQELQTAYKEKLLEQFDIKFNQLFTLCNMPIQRFGSTLISHGQLEDYLLLLKNAHQHANLDSVMCRSLISVDWQGYVYDCDFNQMLGLNMEGKQERTHLSQLLDQQLAGRPVSVRDHCYGCTAGQGSSCGGALS